MKQPLSSDLDHIMRQTPEVWEEMRGARLFVTGGTGFFGAWLLESFAEANRRFRLGAAAVVLTRDKAAFAKKCPHLIVNPAIAFHPGDVRSFSFPEGRFTHVIHAATPASAALNNDAPLEMLDTIVEGTRRVLDFTAACGVHSFLLASSGAVYGRQPKTLDRIPETYEGTPDTMDPGCAYAEGKRMAELLCAIYARRHDFAAKIARCFAFVGPHLPTDTHFAAGNFMRDWLRGGPIRIEGDGTPVRSYLYAADLMIWLWTILVRGVSLRPYNVGSEAEVSIMELARAVAGPGRGVGIVTAKRPVPGALPQRYVPDTQRAERELCLNQFVSLSDALSRTAAWLEETVNAA